MMRHALALALVACGGRPASPMGALGDEALTGWTKICTEMAGHIVEKTEQADGRTTDVWRCRSSSNAFLGSLVLDHTSRHLVVASGDFPKAQLVHVRELVIPALDSQQRIALDWLIATGTGDGSAALRGEGTYVTGVTPHWEGHGTRFHVSAPPSMPGLDTGTVALSLEECANCK